MKRSIMLAATAMAVVLAVGSSAQAAPMAATVEWKGVTWDVLNGTAVVNGDGSLTLTSAVTVSVGATLHANRLSATFDTVMDPWVEWSFAGHKAVAVHGPAGRSEGGGIRVKWASME